jgi:hypothetical protein
LHSDEQHDTFNKLIKAVNYEIDKHFGSWHLPDKAEEEPVNVQVYYPLVILQGDLFCASLKNNRLILKKSNHIQFRKQFISSNKNEAETYQIDVIVESYLPSYLKTVEAEVEKLKVAFQKKKGLVFTSIQKIIEETKKAKGSTLIREHFDF